jgi:hypothetical protein
VTGRKLGEPLRSTGTTLDWTGSLTESYPSWFDLLLAADLHADQSRVHVAAKADRWFNELEYGPVENPGPLPDVDSSRPVRNAFQAIDLVAPAVAGAALELYQATLPLGTMSATWPDPTHDADASTRWAVNGRRPKNAGTAPGMHSSMPFAMISA